MSVLPDTVIADLVIKNKLLDEKSLAQFVEQAHDFNQPLEEIIIEKKGLSDDKLGQVIADYYKVPFVNLSEVTIPDELLNLLPERVMRRQRVLVFSADSSLIFTSSYLFYHLPKIDTDTSFSVGELRRCPDLLHCLEA